MTSTTNSNSPSLAPSVNAGLLADLYAALNRLVLGCPLNVTPGYKINMKTVCEEAARDRSSIKTHKGFKDIRYAIRKAKATAPTSHRSKKKDLDKIRQLKERNRSLREELAARNEKLNEATETIYRLYLQLNRMEEDQKYLLGKVRSARMTSQAVEKAFQVIGFDRFVTETNRVR